MGELRFKTSALDDGNLSKTSSLFDEDLKLSSGIDAMHFSIIFFKSLLRSVDENEPFRVWI